MSAARDNETDGNEAGLRIGAVAKMTGLSVHTLRKWEDRYEAVRPKRSAGGERLYSREDLKRLSLMRRLSSAGMNLRDLAGLGLEALEASWTRLSGETPGAGSVEEPDRILMIAAAGASTPGQIARAPSGHLDLVARASSTAALLETLGDTRVDVCVCELRTIQPESRTRIEELLERSGARSAVIVYGFATRATVDALRRRGVALLRSPADPGDLERAVRDAFGESGAPLPWSPETPPRAAAAGPPTPPTLDLETVARIAASSPRMQCECPQHIADLLFGLRAFEEYSADCENRNAEDAALHHYLWETAGRARALFEEALVRVAHAEGIELD